MEAAIHYRSFKYRTQQFSSHTRLWCFLLRIDDFVYLLREFYLSLIGFNYTKRESIRLCHVCSSGQAIVYTARGESQHIRSIILECCVYGNCMQHYLFL